MSVREYIGARYVPLFMGEWNNANTYEPLSIVTNEGNSYTSRQFVPAGVAIDNNVYWAETGNYNAQVEQYRQEVLGFNGRITAIEQNGWVTTPRIQDNAVTYEKLSTALQERNSAIDALEDRQAYIDGVNGDDDTAQVGYKAHPFKTLDAASKALDELGNNFRFSFLSAGAYNWTMRVITGSVVHFETDECNGDVTVNLVNQWSDGGIFFYDTHIGCYPKNGNNITFNAPQYIEIEGSTLFCAGDASARTTFNCTYLYLISGSGQLAHVTVNGYILGRYGNITFNDLIINNISNNHAFEWNCGILRCEGSSVKISPNPNQTGKHAMLFRSSIVNLNSSTGQTIPNTDYDTFITAYGGVYTISDALMATFKNYATNPPSIGGLRISNNDVISTDLRGSVSVESTAAGQYTDVQVTFGHELPSVPIVVASLFSSTTSVDMGNCAVSVFNITTAGFTVRFFNNGENAKTPSIRWIAAL